MSISICFFVIKSENLLKFLTFISVMKTAITKIQDYEMLEKSHVITKII